MNQQQNNIINQRVYYEYFKDLIAIQDYIMQNPIYTDSYYDGLTQIFTLITSNNQHQITINHSDYTHKIHKQFICVKNSKVTQSKLVRSVKVTNRGLIQCNNKDGTEKMLKYVEMICQIVDSTDIKGMKCKIGFIDSKQKMISVYFDNRNDAINTRNYCIINSALNNLKYNLAGFLHFLIIRFNENRVLKLFRQMQKTSEEMEKLFIIEQNYSPSYSLFSPVQQNEFQQSFQECEGFETTLIDEIVSEYLNEQLDLALADENIEDDSDNELNISQIQLSSHQKFKYSDYHSY